MAKVPVKRAAQPQKYFTYNPTDPRSHLKIKAGQEAAFAKDLGWYAAPKTAAGKPKVIVDVKKGGTSQNQSLFETPAQIEARVTRMAQAAYDRQKSDLDTEAARMRREAEGRRLGMIAAYQAAGNQNAEMASKVQDGWNVAADTLQGIAGSTFGGIGDALQADTAAQEQALSRVGAGGTGFDGRSQQAVEQFRGGALPAESFARYGGIANEYLQRMPDNLKREGLATADAGEREALSKIAQDRLTQVRELGETRTKYESDLREQLMGAQQDQIDAYNDSQKILADVAMKKATLKNQYRVALLRATTQKQIQAAKDIYAASNHALDVAESAALVNQRNASAAASTALAGQRNANPTGAKPPSGASVSAGVARANGIANTLIDSSLAAIAKRGAPSPIPPTSFKGTPKEFLTSEIYAQRVRTSNAWFAAQKAKSFGTIYTKTAKAVAKVMRPLGYNTKQIQQMAFDLVSQKVDPPAGYRTPGGRVVGGGASTLPNIGFNLNPGGRPSV